jgi:protein SCO1
MIMTNNIRLFTYLIIGAIVGLSLIIAANTQAMSDNAPVAKKPKISKEEWERARNYFTDTPLLNQDGESVRFYSDVLDDKVVLINVMYTTCQGSCPITTQMLTKVREKIGPRYGKDIFFVSISNNPKTDTPEVITKFAKKQNALDNSWVFLTGKEAEVNKIIKKLGFFSKNFEEHTAMLIAGNTRTGHWIKIKPGTPMPAIVYKVNALADEG